MGDRANFGFKQSNGHTVYLYGHWAGAYMERRLAAAIMAARGRWADESYATRICISQLIGEAWDKETGWGIHVDEIGDNEYDVPVVDWKAGTVSVYAMDWENFRLTDRVLESYTLDAFVTHYSEVTV